jgi:hypothetical protein
MSNKTQRVFVMPDEILHPVNAYFGLLGQVAQLRNEFVFRKMS